MVLRMIQSVGNWLKRFQRKALVQILPKTEINSFRLILLAEEIQKQPSIDSVVWFLVVTLMKIYEKKQAEQGKLQNVHFEEKKSTRK